MHIPRSLLALTAASALALTLGGPAAIADPPSPPGTKASPVAQDKRAEQAKAALARVEGIVGGNTSAQRGHGHHGRELTLALRDLKLQMDALPAADRKAAQRYFVRPGDGTQDPYLDTTSLPGLSCSANICVHWTETGTDAADGSDGNINTVPAYIAQVRDTIEQVNATYVAAGYRTPRRDGAIGGDTNKVDIYIGNLGDDGLYGYCTTDDPKASQNPPPSWDVWAFCALDNDYDVNEFPTNTPIENMQVTAAHEFFHAVQYAYDFAEDGWLLESTATWAEDELFDDVDDNINYLDAGPLKNPGRALDTYGGLYHYGAWIFWRYLTEKFPAETGGIPNLVLDVWNRADGAVGGPDDYSTVGLGKVLANRGTTLKKELQLFYAANRQPGQNYDEGSANAYPVAGPGLTLNYSGAQTKGADFKPRHMASGSVRLKPNGLSQANWNLKLNFNAPDTAQGGAFVVIVYKQNGTSTTSIMGLNASGGGSKTVPFSSSSTKYVEVLFVNTSTRFTCWTGFQAANGDSYSCSGTPKDDNRASTFTGKAFRG